eukprot:2392483-Rhodomonas_salina.1
MPGTDVGHRGTRVYDGVVKVVVFVNRSPLPTVAHGTCLRACYAMSGTDAACGGATCLCACYEMPGTGWARLVLTGERCATSVRCRGAWASLLLHTGCARRYLPSRCLLTCLCACA